MKKADLYFKDEKSDKEYHMKIEKSGDGYIVPFSYGRVGNQLQEGTKTPVPVSLEEAEKVYEKLLNEKTKKGYIEK